MIKINMDLE